MPPKNPKAGSSTASGLSESETKMMAEIVALMGDDMPKINYEHLAQRINIKFAKNARASAKKLFEKLRSMATANVEGEAEAEHEGGDEEDTIPEEHRPNNSKPKKKSVGKAVAPKKVHATKTKTGAHPAVHKNSNKHKGNGDLSVKDAASLDSAAMEHLDDGGRGSDEDEEYV